MTLSNGATLDLSDSSQTIGSPIATDGAGNKVTLGIGTLSPSTPTVGDSTMTPCSMASFSGTGNVVKQGTGALTLDGISSTHTGLTTVNNGSIILGDATHPTASLVSAVRVTGNTIASPVTSASIFRGIGTASGLSTVHTLSTGSDSG